MSHLVVWLAACLVLACLLRARPVWAVVLVIVLWTAVPAVGGHHLTGLSSGGLGFHPATWLVLVVFVVQLFVDPRPLADAVVRHGLVMLTLAIFALSAFLTSRAAGGGGTRLLLDQIVGPVLVWCLVVAYAHRDVRAALLIRNSVLVTMAVQSVLAVVQSRVGSTIFYTQDFLNIYWFDPETSERWFGTSDSPLVLSLGLVVAACLALGLRSSALRFALFVVYFLGMTITQSRTGAAALVLIIAWSVLRSRTVLWARALTAAALGVAAYLVATSTLVSGLSSRIADDTGSTDARVRALDFVLSRWTDFFPTGHGLISSYSVARDAGLQTSLESAYLMYAVDTGILFATAYFGTQLVLVARYGSQKALPGATLAALLGTLVQHTFSSVAFSNFDGTFIWVALALVVVADGVRRPASAGAGGPSVRRGRVPRRGRQEQPATAHAPAVRSAATSDSS